MSSQSCARRRAYTAEEEAPAVKRWRQEFQAQSPNDEIMNAVSPQATAKDQKNAWSAPTPGDEKIVSLEQNGIRGADEQKFFSSAPIRGAASSGGGCVYVYF